MAAEEAPLSRAPAVFDVSAQYEMQRRAFVPIFGTLGVGFVLVEALTWLSIAREHPHAPPADVDGVLGLVALCFAATIAFVAALLMQRAIRQVRVDEAGIHVVRTWGKEVDHRWTDPSFRLEIRERTPSLGRRLQPPPEYVRVVGRGFPLDLEVPFGVYELALAEASRRGITVQAGAVEVHGRHGTHSWWVTELGAPA